MQATKKTAHERAADENILQDHDTMPTAIEQAVAEFKAGLEGLRQLVNVIGVQCYISGGKVEVVASAQDLERIPGELKVSRRSSVEYPWKLTKTVSGIDFVALAEEDPNEAS